MSIERGESQNTQLVRLSGIDDPEVKNYECVSAARLICDAIGNHDESFVDSLLSSLRTGSTDQLRSHLDPFVFKLVREAVDFVRDSFTNRFDTRAAISFVTEAGVYLLVRFFAKVK